VTEFRVPFAGEADHDIHADGDIRYRPDHFLHERLKKGRIIAAFHQFQNSIIAALQGDMEVRTKICMRREEPEQFIGYFVGFNGTETESCPGILLE